MGLKDLLKDWLGVPTKEDIELAVSEEVTPLLDEIPDLVEYAVGKALREKFKIYNFWGEGLAENEEIHVYCKDEDITYLFEKAEGIYQNGLFIFRLVLGSWDENKQGTLDIVLPEVVQSKFVHGMNHFSVGDAIIKSGSRVKTPFEFPAKVGLTKAFNGLYSLQLLAPAYEHEPFEFPYGEYFDARWKIVQVSSTRKDVPINFHYLQEGGVIQGSINLAEV